MDIPDIERALKSLMRVMPRAFRRLGAEAKNFGQATGTLGALAAVVVILYLAGWLLVAIKIALWLLLGACCLIGGLAAFFGFAARSSATTSAERGANRVIATSSGEAFLIIAAVLASLSGRGEPTAPLPGTSGDATLAPIEGDGDATARGDGTSADTLGRMDAEVEASALISEQIPVAVGARNRTGAAVVVAFIAAVVLIWQRRALINALRPMGLTSWRVRFSSARAVRRAQSLSLATAANEQRTFGPQGSATAVLVSAKRPPGCGFRVLGLFSLILGLGIVWFFLTQFETTVKIPEKRLLGGGLIEASEVHNVGLLNDRQNGIIAGSLVAVLGALSIMIGENVGKKT
jgi:hypothetical protein